MTINPSLDGYDPEGDGPRRILESFHLAMEMEPGPVRDALEQSVLWAIFGATSKAIEHAQEALAAARVRNFRAALDTLVAAGVEAAEARSLPWVNPDSPLIGPTRPRTIGQGGEE